MAATWGAGASQQRAFCFLVVTHGLQNLSSLPGIELMPSAVGSEEAP